MSRHALHFAPLGPISASFSIGECASFLPWPARSSSVAVLDGQLSFLSARFHSGREGSLSPSVSGGLRSSQGFSHVPVMLDEVLELFEDVPDGTVLDATLGGGGHTEALLQARPGISVIGIDQDQVAIDAATGRLAPFASRIHIVKARFDELDEVVSRIIGTDPLVGALFDLGVSTPQLDTAERGFSFRFDAPLDMRMDGGEGATAAELLNAMTQTELESLLKANGETRFARRIASAIVAGRPVTRTNQLAEIVAAAVPAAARRRGHPARRVFQALRIETNEELAILPLAVDAAIERTRPGGRVVVLSYHSGEDRIVKERFAFAASGGCTCPPGFPCVCGALSIARLITRGAKLPSSAEVDTNPRAEAARLRAIERIEPTPVRRSR